MEVHHHPERKFAVAGWQFAGTRIDKLKTTQYRLKTVPKGFIRTN
jgi:hypothetical protein